jgi:hypothetical protein
MNKKKRLEKILSLFEIFIFVISIITFSYFVGNDFKFVSASSALRVSDIGSIGSTPAVSPIPTPAGSVSVSGVDLSKYSLELGSEALEEATEKAAWKQFATNIKGSTGALIGNAVIAVGIWYVTYYLSKWGGASEQFAQSLSWALAGGYGVGALSSIILSAAGVQLTPFLFAGFGGGLIGLGVGALAFVLFYRDERVDSIQFTCYPWQPVTGGDYCSECNKGQFPCSEYKCKSLGANCDVVKIGTDEEACFYNNSKDISAPIISAWKERLNEGYEYQPITTASGDKGVIINYTKSSDGCIPAFTRLKYGVSLNELGRCKVDTNRTIDFSTMKQYTSYGYPAYNHSLLSVQGGLIESENEGVTTCPNNGNCEIHVRCEDMNGNSNTGTFVFKYCVQKGKDINAPEIELTDPLSGSFIEKGVTSQDINVYTDKPADCKWSHNDESYDSMPEIMTCSQSITEMNANMLYKCNTTLTGLKDKTENKFYFNCKSYPKNNESDRYTMTKNKEYTLIGTESLVISSVSPNDTTIKDSTQSVNVTLRVKTSAGYDEGQAYCSFKNSSESDNTYILFANTNSYTHSQELWLDEGSYKYTIKCCDIYELAGNCDEEKIKFDVETDFEPPVVVRVYNDNTQLKIITNEKAECVYGTNSCSYEFIDGVKFTTINSKEHSTDWDTGNNFYIKCQDEFGTGPDYDECSIIARPFSSY